MTSREIQDSATYLAVRNLHVEDRVVAQLVDGLFDDHFVAALVLEDQDELEQLID